MQWEASKAEVEGAENGLGGKGAEIGNFEEPKSKAPKGPGESASRSRKFKGDTVDGIK
jgi:hypothetical protein